MANLTGTYDPAAEAQTDIGKLPTGEYVAQIVDSDLKPTKSGGHYLELAYEVTEGPYKGRKHWERLSLDNANSTTVEIANRQFASVREATGVANPKDSTELHFIPHVIRVEFYAAGSAKRNGQVRDRDEAKIRAWKPLEGGAAPAAQQPAANTAPAAAGARPAWASRPAA